MNHSNSENEYTVGPARCILAGVYAGPGHFRMSNGQNSDICYRDFELGELVIVLQCEHYYCADCTQQWMETSWPYACPYYKAKMPGDGECEWDPDIPYLAEKPNSVRLLVPQRGAADLEVKDALGAWFRPYGGGPMANLPDEPGPDNAPPQQMGLLQNLLQFLELDLGGDEESSDEEDGDAPEESDDAPDEEHWDSRDEEYFSDEFFIPLSEQDDDYDP
ncbi:hypothetical protein BDY21DRAFT_374170 [Lineolata rhizophorae]|uniref:RING-type domain-containing protein n=1 Tax=Lineolata rhizophorae TaxID=578093 RepID=A0A6A6NS45_9PEZI|nr:hypothetical protein BDY21DRAFT_374170 [Lineolata rhizophorae]